MFFHRPDAATLRWLGTASLGIAAAIFVNPDTGLDLLLLGLLLVMIGHVFLREKLLLVFLALRPAVDYWRDAALFQYHAASVNVNAALALLFFGWSSWMLLVHRRSLRTVPLRYALPLFSAWMIGSALWSVAPLTTVIETIKFLNLAAFFWLAYIGIQSGKIRHQDLVNAIIISAILPISAGIIQLSSGTGITTESVHGRIFGTLGHPNVFAFFLLSLIILHAEFTMLQPQPIWKKWPGVQAMIGALLALLLLFTYARAAYIGLAVSAFIIGLYDRRRLVIKAVIVLALIAASLSPLDAFLINNFNVGLAGIPIIGRITARDEDADSIAWRQSVIRETIPIIHKRPLLGFGYGAFPQVWADNRSHDHFYDDQTEAHNDYLRLGLELGLIGLGLYVIIIGRLIWLSAVPALKHPKKYLHLLAWVITFAVLSLSDNMLHHTPVVWLTFAWWGAVLATAPKARVSPNLLQG